MEALVNDDAKLKENIEKMQGQFDTYINIIDALETKVLEVTKAIAELPRQKTSTASANCSPRQAPGEDRRNRSATGDLNMNVTKVAYTRKFNIGNYESVDVSIEAQLNDKDNPLEVWSILADNAEMWFIGEKTRKKGASATPKRNLQSTTLARSRGLKDVAVNESVFAALKWDLQHSDKMGEYEIARRSEQQHLQIRYGTQNLGGKQHQNQRSLPRPTYAYSYWLYGEAIFRQKLEQEKT